MHMMQSAAPAHSGCCSLLGGSHKPSRPDRTGSGNGVHQTQGTTRTTLHTRQAPAACLVSLSSQQWPCWSSSHRRMALMHVPTSQNSGSN